MTQLPICPWCSVFVPYSSCRRALRELLESSLLEGWPGRLLLTYDLGALEDRRYFTAGALVGWSLAQGGPGLCCLHPDFYQLMCGNSPSLEDFNWREVADTDIQSQLQQVWQHTVHILRRSNICAAIHVHQSTFD